LRKAGLKNNVKKRIIHIILLSCRTATRLIEKKLHQKLSGRESVQLKWHKTVCDACTLYEKQVIMLDSILKKTPTDFETTHEFSRQEIDLLENKIISSIKK
jgi:hypothetical protein